MSKALQIAQTMSLPSVTDSVSNYIRQIYKIPVLDVEQEQGLAKELRENNNLEAAKTLVLAHLRFVVRVAKGYQGYGLNLADLIQEGNIGLMKAVKRFDPSHGVRLVSFAVHWIKAEIHEFVIRNWRIVKVATTKAQRKLFFNLRSMKKRLGWMGKAEIEGVAQDLGVSEKDVLEMESRLNAQDSSFDLPVNDDDEKAFAPSQYLEDNSLNPARLIEHNDSEQKQHENLQFALQSLDERSREIVTQRWLADSKATLHDLAAKYAISAERVRQLEANAMKKLKHSLA